MKEPMTMQPIPIQDEVFGFEDHEVMKEPETKRDELRNPFWIQDNEVLSGPRGYLKKAEIEFWKGMIHDNRVLIHKKYPYSIISD